MKLEIQQGAQKPGGIEYQCVMVGRANVTITLINE